MGARALGIWKPCCAVMLANRAHVFFIGLAWLRARSGSEPRGFFSGIIIQDLTTFLILLMIDSPSLCHLHTEAIEPKVKRPGGMAGHRGCRR